MKKIPRRILPVILLCAGIAALPGCGHNISVQGFGAATPLGAVGYGSFHCIRDNTSVENSRQEKSGKYQITSRIVTGAQK